MISRVNHHQKMSFSKCMSGDIFLLILLVACSRRSGGEMAVISVSERATVDFADSRCT